MRTILALILAASLSACVTTTTYTPAQALLVSCKAYARTLTALAGFRASGSLTEAQIATVDQWRPVLNDACQPGVTPSGDLLTTVEDALLKLIAVEEDAQS